MSSAGTRRVPEGETHVERIWCPDCGWTKVVEKDGPADAEYAPTMPAARYFARNDIARHVSEREFFLNESCTPFLFRSDGSIRRFEPEVCDFVE